jgi:hypothetical protein
MTNVWEFAAAEGRSGTGNWEAFDRSLDEVRRAAEPWRQALRGCEKPWLCWNLNDRWSVVQQKLVRSVGWTPVVGWDPSNGVGCPPLIPEAIAIDFNADLKLPALWVHVPLEFAFLWTERLAFWHADLLMRRAKLERAVRLFERLDDGAMTAVFSYGGLRGLLRPRSYRYWELLGCTTREASESQFRHGCGWWRCIWRHPSCTDERERERRRQYSYDHGVGIMYWKRRYGGRVRSISERWAAEGHFGSFSVPGYQQAASKSEEMDLNFDLGRIGRQLGIEEFV